jgi:hypothetical protein
MGARVAEPRRQWGGCRDSPASRPNAEPRTSRDVLPVLSTAVSGSTSRPRPNHLAGLVAFQESFWLEFLRPTLTPVGKQKPHKTGD